MKLGLVLVAALVACGPSAVVTGSEGGHCYANMTCNAGLTCSNNTCAIGGDDIDAAVIIDGAIDDAIVHDDTNLNHPDSHLDSGTVPDAVIPDAQVGDAGMIDSGVLPDASTDAGTMIDAGMMTDAGTDSGVLPDAALPDAGGTCNVLAQTGCTATQKCTWILDTDGTASMSGLGHIGCAPNGTVATGSACTILPAASGGYDNCVRADQCVNNTCKTICDDTGGTPACGANQGCVVYDGLFANSGSTTTPAGVCDPTCSPLDDNDFDGSGTAHAKVGTACSTDPLVGCYGTPSSAHTTFFTCAPAASGTGLLTHRSVLPASSIYVNSCMSGYTIAFSTDAFGSTNVDCYAFCKPGDAYLNNPGTQIPNGSAPHRCNTTDALGAFGATPSAANNGTNGEHCMYSWFFEIDDATGNHTPSPTSNSVGICWDHSKYKYDSNGDGSITAADSALPACTALPLTSATGALTADQFACISTTTAGITFTGKPKKLTHPYIEGLPEFPTLKTR
jgi:hypothetical protein